jgi:hypothetical protein
MLQMMTLRRDLSVATSARDEVQLAKTRLEYLVQRLQGYDDTMLPLGKEDRAALLVRQLNGLLQQHVRGMPSSSLLGIIVLTKHHRTRHQVQHDNSLTDSCDTARAHPATAVSTEEDGHDGRQQQQDSVGSLHETAFTSSERNEQVQQLARTISFKSMEEETLSAITLKDHLR